METDICNLICDTLIGNILLEVCPKRGIHKLNGDVAYIVHLLASKQASNQSIIYRLYRLYRLQASVPVN